MTNSTTLSSAEIAPASEPAVGMSPFILEFFIVQGPGFRCMAYCDEGGAWRNAFNNEELLGEINILE